MNAKKMQDVLIIGGGVAGLTLADRLAYEGLTVAVIDQRPIAIRPLAQPYELRVSAITRASQRIFEQTGVWSRIVSERVSPYQGMHVWDGESAGSIKFDASDMGEPNLGHIIENQVIANALIANLQHSPRVEWISGEEPTSVMVDDASVTLNFTSGLVVKGRCLVGADGAESWVRNVSGIELTQRPYAQKALVCTVTTERSHEAVAYQRFTQQGPLAFLPLPDPHMASIVWSNEPDRIENLMGLGEASFCKQLARSFEHYLGAVTHAGARATFPLTMRHAHTYIAERTALVGDAIHTIHPLAGQGLNLGLQDVACLANALALAKQQGKDIGSKSVLRSYERARKGPNMAMIALMDAFKVGFGTAQPGIKLWRNLGLKLTDGVKPFKNFLARTALGT